MRSALFLMCATLGCGQPAPPGLAAQGEPAQRDRTPAQTDDLVPMLDSSGFEAAVAQAVCLIDFYADDCPPCHAMRPIVASLAAELRGSLHVYRVDADAAADLADAQQIEVLPTFVVYKQGRAVARIEGALPAEEFRNWLDEHR